MADAAGRLHRGVGDRRSLAVTTRPLAVAVGVAVSVPGRRRRRLAFDMALVGLLDDLVRALRAGHTLRDALVDTAPKAGPLADRLRSVAGSLARGSSVTAALTHLTQGVDTEPMRMTATMLGLAEAHPVAAARSLRTASVAIRAEVELVREIGVLTAQAETSARVLTALPLVMIMLAALRQGRGAEVLWHTSVGRACLAVAGVLVAAGWVWMRLLVRSVVPR